MAGSKTPPMENSHDGFFREFMSHRQAYLPFLRTYLPKDIARAIDFESVRPGNGHFVDAEFRSLYSD
jgi:predicted transposase YdaD